MSWCYNCILKPRVFVFNNSSSILLVFYFFFSFLFFATVMLSLISLSLSYIVLCIPLTNKNVKKKTIAVITMQLFIRAVKEFKLKKKTYNFLIIIHLIKVYYSYYNKSLEKKSYVTLDVQLKISSRGSIR